MIRFLAVSLLLVTATASGQQANMLPVEVEKLDSIREALSSHIVFLNLRKVMKELEDPRFLPEESAIGVLVRKGSDVFVATSETVLLEHELVEEHDRDGKKLKTDKGFVALKFGVKGVRCLDCSKGKGALLASKGACEKGKVLWFVVPEGGGQFVLGQTVIASEIGELPDNLVVVAGKLNAGVPLFAPDQKLAGIVVRGTEDGASRSLVAPLCEEGE
jgi:hypothetical protein